MKPSPAPEFVRVEIQISKEAADALALLGSGWAVGASSKPPEERLRAALLHMVHAAADGVRRPGAWERAWVEQGFGDGWEDKLEVDPDAPWRRRVVR